MGSGGTVGREEGKNKSSFFGPTMCDAKACKKYISIKLLSKPKHERRKNSDPLLTYVNVIAVM